MKKRIFALLFISLIFLSLISGVFADYCQGSAGNKLAGYNEAGCITQSGTWIREDSPTTSATGDVTSRTEELKKEYGLNDFFASRIATWELGALGDQGLAGTTLKYLVLALVILLIYSALTYANFPDTFAGSGGAVTRLLISVIVGLLATFAITTNELLAMLQSYTALGITLTLFFPIMILMFFTIVTARAASPIGIFGQKIIWIIYSVYLFAKTAIYLIIANKYMILRMEAGWIKDTVDFFMGEKTVDAIQTLDPVILTIMLITSIAVFIIFVWRDDAVIAWVAKEARDSELEAQKSMLERSHTYDKLRAEEMKRT